MKKTLLFLVTSFSLAASSPAVVLVEDLPNLSNNILDQIRNYAQYAQQTLNGFEQIARLGTQITNQVTQIENQVVELERLGNPQYYVNLLHLSDFMAVAGALSAGAGNTLTQIQSGANGIAALSYTANGLYSNLSGTVDRFGNPVQYSNDSFRKFAAVNEGYDAFDQSLRTYNQQSGSLQQQLTVAVNNLNGSGDLISSVKHLGHLIGIQTEVIASGFNALLSAERVSAQHQMNQNDAARVQEAQRQQEIQERQADLQQLSSRFGRAIGGSGVQTSGGLP
jgi:hypothetical protein